MSCLVSVIIPAYNAAAHIAEMLASVLHQTYTNLEIIVVDDGSVDETERVVHAFTDSRLTFVRQDHAGACAARNNGLLRSKGVFIQFLDADDLLSKNKIEAQVKLLLSETDPQTSIAHCCLSRFVGNNIHRIIKAEPHKAIRRHLKPIEWIIENRVTVTGCWLVPRQLIKVAGLWNETLIRSQDEEFITRLIAHANRVLYCDEAILHYRNDTAFSISKNVSAIAASSKLRAIELIEEQLLKLENSSRIKKVIANKYLEFIYLNFIPHPHLALLAERRIKALGGADNLPGGLMLKGLSKVIGWRNAMMIKRAIKAKNIFGFEDAAA